MDIKAYLNSRPKLKTFVLYLITSPHNPRPRWWVRNLVHPFIIKKGKKALIRGRTRIDIFPWHRFEIGSYSTIEDFCTVNNGAGPVIIGDNVRIGLGSVLMGPVTIKDGTALGQNVFLAGFNHGYTNAETNTRLQPLDLKDTCVHEDALVGANSVVLAGVTIGRGAQVGAGSVVTKDVPPLSIAVGNPAKVIKQYDSEKREWIRVD